jgi:hypothetical protein
MRYKALWASALLTTATFTSAVSMANSHPTGKFDGIGPIQFSIIPVAPVAGQSINLTVVMQNAAGHARYIPVTSSTPGNFDVLPDTITVPAGSTVGTGSAVIRVGAEGTISVTAGELTASAALSSKVHGGN